MLTGGADADPTTAELVVVFAAGARDHVQVGLHISEAYLALPVTFSGAPIEFTLVPITECWFISILTILVRLLVSTLYDCSGIFDSLDYFNVACTTAYIPGY